MEQLSPCITILMPACLESMFMVKGATTRKSHCTAMRSSPCLPQLEKACVQNWKSDSAQPSVQFSSVAQSCLTLYDPMNHSTPDLPVYHQISEFTQTHVHQVGDAIQPSHTLLSPSPYAPNPSQHQDLFQWVNCSHEVDTYILIHSYIITTINKIERENRFHPGLLWKHMGHKAWRNHSRLIRNYFCCITGREASDLLLPLSWVPGCQCDRVKAGVRSCSSLFKLSHSSLSYSHSIILWFLHSTAKKSRSHCSLHWNPIENISHSYLTLPIL